MIFLQCNQHQRNYFTKLVNWKWTSLYWADPTDRIFPFACQLLKWRLKKESILKFHIHLDLMVEFSFFFNFYFFRLFIFLCLPVSSSTRYFTSNALNLIRVTKGKNIIISSQAHSSNELRAPYDVCSL